MRHHVGNQLNVSMHWPSLNSPFIHLFIPISKLFQKALEEPISNQLLTIVATYNS